MKSLAEKYVAMLDHFMVHYGLFHRPYMKCSYTLEMISCMAFSYGTVEILWVQLENQW